MKRIIWLSSVMGLFLLASGCAHERMAKSGPPVPVPATTPFDNNLLARQEYIMAYEQGYRAVADGYAPTVTFDTGPRRFARELGYRAGASQASYDMKKGQ